MAALDFGQVTLSAGTPQLLFTVPTAQQGFVSFTTPTAGGVFIGNKQSVSTATGYLIPQNIPTSIDLKANQGTQCWAVSTGAATVSWIFGA